MLARTLNLGILAHVDAGKTTLTERLLHAAGVIDEPGSVDDGTTQTDTLALERQRGITIKSAVVSFAVDDVTVNLIDTPGHPDFIAEVERVLSVLDGAVLVLSAVEGVQAQTSVLMRALQRLRVPTLLFVNKIDRVGADPARVLAQIRDRLTPAAVPMGTASELGTRAARFVPSEGSSDALVSVLAEHDDALLAAYVEDESSVPHELLRSVLAAQSREALVHPVYFGSASTGAGVDEVMAGLVELLPARAGDGEAPASGTVFKIERGPAGEKVAYVRLFAGTVQTRDRIMLGGQHEAKVTAIRVFDRGPAVPSGSVRAGQIGKLWGLAEVRIGDAIGTPPPPRLRHAFAPPTLETVIDPVDPAARGALRAALSQLAEQDPLIAVRQDDDRHELSVSLYGEVQKEVIEATLAAEYGLEVTFHETTTICVERPVGTGSAVELLGASGNPFLATVGLHVAPAPLGAGISVDLDVEVGSLPLYVYGAVEPFRQALEDTTRATLSEGLYGWQVTDCAVTLTQCDYAAPSTGARDYRLLTPLVLMSALRQAATIVCEPVDRFRLELPADALGTVMPALARLGAVPQAPELRGSLAVLEGHVVAALTHDLQRDIRGLTHGEGVLETSFDRYEPVSGEPPTRPRSDANPLNRKEYLLRVTRRRLGQEGPRARA